MQLQDRVYLVGSGVMGFDMTDPYDCHVFLIDGGDELALIDVGAGLGVGQILRNVQGAGFDPGRIRHVIATHGHADHTGGLRAMLDALDSPTVHAEGETARRLREADEDAFGLAVAKAGGYYPDEYVLAPCEVDSEVREGDEIAVGDLRLEVIETPGHCDGHISLLCSHEGRRTLFSGDSIFHGGNIFLQNVFDSRLDKQIETLRKLRGLEIDALFPSHLSFSLSNGQRHIERANDALDRLALPNQLVNGW